MKKVILVLIVLTFLSVGVCAEEIPEISSDYAIVYNVENDMILFEKGADSIIYPASLVKIMTGILACEYYDENGNVDVVVSQSALDMVKGNKVGLKAGETVPFYDLMCAALVGSGNDACYVIAETVGGSVDVFINMMNEKAKSLGALHTNYSNPGGYHSSYMLTTLYDQALISAYASQNKTLLDITSLVSYTMPETNLSKKRTFTNQNLLFDDSHWLRHYTPNTAGLNVGMTSEAGWCISTVFYDDGLTDIVIVSGGTLVNYEHKYLADAKNLMKYAKDQYDFVKVLDKSRVFYDMPVKLDDDKDKILLVTDSEIVSLLPADINTDTDIRLESSVDTHELIAPVQAGDVFGTVSAYYGERLLGVANLVATTSAKRSLKLFVFDKIQKFFANEIVKSIFVFLSSLIFVFLVAIFIYVCIKRRKKRLRQRRYIARGKTHARKDLK